MGCQRVTTNLCSALMICLHAEWIDSIGSRGAPPPAIPPQSPNMHDDEGAARERLTIAHVMGYYIPGLGYQENFLPFEQASLGHDVHIVTSDRLAPHPSYKTVYEPTVGPRMVGSGTGVERDVTIHRLPVSFELRRHNNPWIRGSASLLDNLAPDIVHLHGVTPWSSLGIIFSRAARRHRLVCDHHLCHFNLVPFTQMKRTYYAGFRLFCATAAQRRVGAWLPINEDARDVLQTVLGITEENVIINRLGVDVSHFYPDPVSGRHWRQAHGIPADATLVVQAGRLEPRKKTEDLLTAFALAFPGRSGSDSWLCVAGDGDNEYISALKKQASDVGIAERTRFLPMQPHEILPSLFNAADVGVWPGDVAVTLIEALGCGLPVAIPTKPGLSYVAHCPGAHAFDGGDIDSLASLMARLASTDTASRSQVAHGCADRLGWTTIAAQSVEIYRDVIARSLAMQ
jgi:glycosyltransferase involved in cell wall biosynthesis